jgi:trans-feruloyl-CoA hydratase/vanillin synthase
MTEYKYDFVKIRVHDGIAWTALNRPEKRNAMSPALHYEMDDALARLEVDDNVKVVVVTGEGGNFSAGQDLKKFFRELEKDPAERKKAAAAANRWRWERIYGYDKPTIAMVHGYCVGGAFMQLLACDFAIAAENATFSLSEVNWGILSPARWCRRWCPTWCCRATRSTTPASAMRSTARRPRASEWSILPFRRRSSRPRPPNSRRS